MHRLIKIYQFMDKIRRNCRLFKQNSQYSSWKSTIPILASKQKKAEHLPGFFLPWEVLLKA